MRLIPPQMKQWGALFFIFPPDQNGSTPLLQASLRTISRTPFPLLEKRQSSENNKLFHKRREISFQPMKM
ncbi:MAG: hypothetical protein C4520_07875 [Candidatus Abyssobacteria bacterium SURF_5]|uniref:Uncharacterized protein n=1 Tax=Abyssobacteria bacterium (strain SURF_5) TaxID=2093360 RepID=A0A3A4NX05_ABYX5|nr:MAG: hypothetical protein C4520_07875 [Candidatus Abyssubacteria bacterium SURF_5]